MRARVRCANHAPEKGLQHRSKHRRAQTADATKPSRKCFATSILRNKGGNRNRRQKVRISLREMVSNDRLMPEMPAICEDHRDPVVVTSSNHLVISPRTAGLNQGRDARLGRTVDRIREREKGV